MLARELGLPRQEMLRRMSSQELTGWMAYFTLLGAERDAESGTTRS